MAHEELAVPQQQIEVVTNVSGDVLPNSMFDVSWFKSERDNQPVAESVSWTNIKRILTSSKPRNNKKGGLCWSPNLYRDGAIRGLSGVEHVSMAVGDYDSGVSIESVEAKLQGYAYIIHTSFSHTPEHPKFRVILPLSRPVVAADWPMVWAKINHFLGGVIDQVAKDASRMYFRPSHPKGTVPISKVNEGQFFDVSVLSEPPNAPITKQARSYDKEGQNTARTHIEGIESSNELSPHEGLQAMVSRCQFMQWASNPDTQCHVQEPLWRAMISNACRFEGGEEWIHTASEHHPSYDQDATDKKIRHVASGYAPITCAYIRDIGFNSCPEGGCARRGGEPTRAPAGLVSWIYSTRTAPAPATASATASIIASSSAAANVARMRVPPQVAGFVENYYPEGLVYINNTFYGYADGYYQRLEIGPEMNRKVAVYLANKATDEELSKVSRNKVDALVGLLECYYASRDGNDAPNKSLICLTNGTLDTSTYELIPHSPNHCLMTKTDIEWNADAQCSRWLQFIEEIFANDIDKQQKIDFIQEWFGYCLVPDASQHKFVWMIGAGGNGKSILLLILRKIVGEANVSDAAIERLDRGPVRAELEGKLVNISSEIAAEATVADGYLKQIVGGEPVEAERKYQPSFTFRPYVRMIGATNVLPRLLDTTDGFARRAVILPFNRQFRGDECDPGLEEKLLTELPGIFVWAVEGLRRLRARGKFNIPQSSTAAMAQYRTESDPVALYLAECLEPAEQGGLKASRLYDGYKEWQRANGYQSINIVTFGKRLSALGCSKYESAGTTTWRLKLKATAPTDVAWILAESTTEDPTGVGRRISSSGIFH